VRAEQRHVRRHHGLIDLTVALQGAPLFAGLDRAMRTNRRFIRLTACATVTATLAACGGVQIKPETALPKPIIVTMPAHVGFVMPAETRTYTHSETRWGVDWTVQLGEGHRNMMLAVLKDEFS